MSNHKQIAEDYDNVLYHKVKEIMNIKKRNYKRKINVYFTQHN